LPDRLNTPLHPSLDGKGIDVDIPDFVDRCENGNGFKVGAEMTGPRTINKKDRVGISIWQAHGCPHENVGIAHDWGRLEGAIDGVGLRYEACGLASNIAVGPIDIGAKVGTAQLGGKIWEPSVGLDAGFKANASALELRGGPVTANLGVGYDTGVKIGKEGVGVEVLGTGVEIGRTTKVSLFGSSFSLKLW
ncbi:unnamed protein product, partial [Adineta ricciae]